MEEIKVTFIESIFIEYLNKKVEESKEEISEKGIIEVPTKEIIDDLKDEIIKTNEYRKMLDHENNVNLEAFIKAVIISIALRLEKSDSCHTYIITKNTVAIVSKEKAIKILMSNALENHTSFLITITRIRKILKNCNIDGKEYIKSLIKDMEKGKTDIFEIFDETKDSEEECQA